MICEGSTALPYEPYTGGQPSPNPDYPQEIVSAGNYNEETQKWEYEVNITGKNLLDIPSYVEKNSDFYELGEHGGVVQIANDGRAMTTLPIVQTLPAGTYFVNRRDANIQVVANGAEIRINNATNSFTLETVADIAFKLYKGNTAEYPTEEYYPMLCKDSQSLISYEPYRTPQTVLLTSDRPLTKWDKLGKRNGQWGWVYKSAEIESYTDESVPGEYYSTTGQLSTGAQVWYETTTETFIPLTASEQEAMNELYTFRPTTVLSNDCGCNMSLMYKTKKSLEVTT